MEVLLLDKKKPGDEPPGLFLLKYLKKGGCYCKSVMVDRLQHLYHSCSSVVDLQEELLGSPNNEYTTPFVGELQ